MNRRQHGWALSVLGALACSSLILHGACGESGEPQDSGERYHPEDYLEPYLHGMDAKLQADDCLLCHGDDLTGGVSEYSCDACHDTEWRTTCIFCHGGQETDGGAPPRDIRDTTTESDLSFPPHTAHVTTTLREPLDCASCHGTPPEDALSPGHFLVDDTTPGTAEVDLSAGLSSQASYSASLGCSNVYCHGNGQGHNGEVAVGDGPMQCDSCHPSIESSRDHWDTMSGKHKKHLREDVECSDCHGPTTQDDESIHTAALHIDGEIQLDFPYQLDYSGGSCDGECHDEDHDDEDWD